MIWHHRLPPSGLWVSGNASTGQWLLRARKERRGLLVVTGTTGRTSCGTPERLRPSIRHPLNATAHSAARANHHVPQWCCILAEVVYGTVATRPFTLSTTAAVAAMVLCTWRYGRMWVLVWVCIECAEECGLRHLEQRTLGIVLSSLARHCDTSVRQPAVTRTLMPCPWRVPALWWFADCIVPSALSGLYRSLRHLVFVCDQVPEEQKYVFCDRLNDLEFCRIPQTASR